MQLQITYAAHEFLFFIRRKLAVAYAQKPTQASVGAARKPLLTRGRDRVVHGKEIMAIFAGLLLKKPVAYWLDELERAGVPGPINGFSQACLAIHTCSRAACRSRSSIPSSLICRRYRHPREGVPRPAAAGGEQQRSAGEHRL